MQTRAVGRWPEYPQSGQEPRCPRREPVFLTCPYAFGPKQRRLIIVSEAHETASYWLRLGGGKRQPTSALGQGRHFDRGPAPSGLPRRTDILGVRRHVSN